MGTSKTIFPIKLIAEESLKSLKKDEMVFERDQISCARVRRKLELKLPDIYAEIGLEHQNFDQNNHVRNKNGAG